MKKAKSNTFLKVYIMSFILLCILSFLSLGIVFAMDEGTMDQNAFWVLFSYVFSVLRFPTHIIGGHFLSGGILPFVIGLIINANLYALIIAFVRHCLIKMKGVEVG